MTTAKRTVRAMIADDEPHIRAMLKLIISSLGAEVVADTGDGQSAVELFRAHQPDLVLLDINMPRLDGIKVLKQIMAINGKTLVIMLTAQNTMDSVRESLDAGARNYILKNNSSDELVRLITESWADYLTEIHAAKDFMAS
jgi:YesN/AraC family two-component response regulator